MKTAVSPTNRRTECLCVLGRRSGSRRSELEQRTWYPGLSAHGRWPFAKTKAPVSILAAGHRTQIKLLDSAATIRHVRPALPLPSRPRRWFSSNQKQPRQVREEPASTPVSRPLAREIPPQHTLPIFPMFFILTFDSCHLLWKVWTDFISAPPKRLD